MISEPFGNNWPARCTAALYVLIVSIRNFLYDSIPFLSKNAGIPVVSVGGVHAGGTGKTPVVRLLCELFDTKQTTVGIASRGYGRLLRTPKLIAPGERSCWEDIGDEPAMLRQNEPGLWVSVDADRVRAARALSNSMPSDKPRVVILDDGFQHRRLRRNIDLVCLPANPWQSLSIPAGYLREPLSSLRRATVVLIIGDENECAAMQLDASRVRERFGIRHVYVLVRKTGPWINALTGQQSDAPPGTRPALIAAIAHPKRFTDAVRMHGQNPVTELIFPDHHRFYPADLTELDRVGADSILTTEKDAVRLMTINLANGRTIWYLKLGLGFVSPSDRAELILFLRNETFMTRGPQ